MGPTGQTRRVSSIGLGVGPEPAGHPGVVGRALLVGNALAIAAMPARFAALRPGLLPLANIFVVTLLAALAPPVTQRASQPLGCTNDRRSLVGRALLGRLGHDAS